VIGIKELESLKQHTKRGLCVASMSLLMMPLQGHAVTSTDLYQCALVNALPTGGGISSADPTIDSGGIVRWTNPAQGRAFYKVELDAFDPNAVCNDGSPAVMYVRRAPSLIPNTNNPNPNGHRWHIHLQGGGSCRDHESCVTRWCGVGAGTDVKAGLMSSRGTPSRMRGTGILLEHNQNRFSTYNQILVKYCSSDTWLGDAGPGSVVTGDLNDQDFGNQLATDIQFRGTRIVNAVMDALETSSGLPVSDNEGNTVFTLPEMSLAQSVLLSGDSAGGNGIRHNLDRLHARIDANSIYTANGNEDGIPVIGFLDAGGFPFPSDTRIIYANHPEGYTSYTDMMNLTYQQQETFHGVTPAALDDSCFNHETNFALCADHSNVQKNYITTPLFNRFR